MMRFRRKRTPKYPVTIWTALISLAVHDIAKAIARFFENDRPNNPTTFIIAIAAIGCGFWIDRSIKEYINRDPHAEDDIAKKELSRYAAIGFSVAIISLAGLVNDLHVYSVSQHATWDIAGTITAELIGVALGAWLTLSPWKIRNWLDRLMPEGK